ncbi:maker215 [Drosophila busckii]|uniref:Maker215 n=1 Tax=Drosophila busckii TaxID=30019 RepID=A0A0M4F521_DROBS|nr:maker215 [Drosophila busckii]
MPFKPDSSYDAQNKIWSGPETQDYFASDLSIGQIIFHEMRRHPKLIAQVSPTENTSLTREELHLNSMRVASYFRQLGLAQTDIVGIIARNTTHMSAVAYGCFFNGIAFHSLNVTFEQATIERHFSITKPLLIFCDGDEYEKVKAATSMLNVKFITMRNHQSGVMSIEQILETPVEPHFEPARLEQGNKQTLAILCSSGTTGLPKAVTISNSRKILNCATYLTTADVQFTQSTLDWVTGLLTTVTSGVYSTTRIIVDTPIDPAYFLRMVEEYKVTWVLQSSSHMAMITNCSEFETANLQSLRAYLYGGGKCSVPVQHRMRSHLALDCLHFAYGFTESGTVVSMNWNFDEKPNSCGRLVEGFKVKILDEQGVPLGPNQVGEICAYDGEFWAGYYDNPEESCIMRDSKLWFHTGDLGYMDDDGFLFILDRKKDMLKSCHGVYYPHEIEEVIARMPQVAEVCVFGIWNELEADAAAASVVARPGFELQSSQVLEFVREHISIKILDEQGVPLGPNQVGEISAYDGEFWAGYYDNSEESSIMRDSKLWFHTGDLGYMDDDGFLFILDRKKDMLRFLGIGHWSLIVCRR